MIVLGVWGSEVYNYLNSITKRNTDEKAIINVQVDLPIGYVFIFRGL